MGLRDLVEKFVISLELGEHKKVAELSSKICTNLIELLDDYLTEQDEDSEDEQLNNTSDNNQLIQAIGSICDNLRKFDDIAVAYHDVTSFVHLYDMVCFSRMVGAIPCNNHQAINSTTDQAEHELPIDVNHLAFIMRSACHLLRYMNASDDGPGAANWPIACESLWFDVREQIDKISGVGFPIYTLDISAAISSNEQEQLFNSTNSSIVHHLKSLCAPGDDDDGGSELSQIVASEWFKQFLEISLSQSYPLDRFSSLIALWIVADICGCNSLEQMLSEMVDQIFHEESNSCNTDELLQLGAQVGSYWLSYHRRFRATFVRASAASIELDDDDDSEDNELSDSDAGSGKFPIDVGNSTNKNSRAKLRRLIKEELLEGPNCVICGSQPHEPLACLRHQHSCPQCLSELSRGADFCALSRRTLPLVRLETLRFHTSAKQKQQLVTLLSQSEWTRHGLATMTTLRPKLSSRPQLETTEISERIDIETNFERLTIIRDDQMDDKNDLDRDSDDEDDEDELSEMDSTLRDFMISTWSSRQDSSASESIKMLRFVLNSRRQRTGSSSNLFLCSDDFLILDQRNDWRQVQLRLMTANCLIAFSNGNLWICDSCSSISKLKLGCGRLFSSLELLRHTTTTTTTTTLDGFSCCFCQRELRKRDKQFLKQLSQANRLIGSFWEISRIASYRIEMQIK